MAEIHIAFFYKLKLIKDKVSPECFSNSYEEFMGYNHYYMSIILVVINIAFAVMLAIPFVLLHIYLIFLLLVISLPFKNYPLKYLIGITLSSGL